jgi:hypothetical protein
MLDQLLNKHLQRLGALGGALRARGRRADSACSPERPPADPGVDRVVVALWPADLSGAGPGMPRRRSRAGRRPGAPRPGDRSRRSGLMAARGPGCRGAVIAAASSPRRRDRPCSAPGRFPDRRLLCRRLRPRLAARAQVDERVHTHGLRHTHATELTRDGIASDATRETQVVWRSLAATCATPYASRSSCALRRWEPAEAGREDHRDGGCLEGHQAQALRS